ncbi:hypothetical protein CP533_0736 [Ophiocordyceps camponoti-saundersi (nom. inval.)]|nr:hypothetical protein CP533_0736 [Ophiocordyceps camponoti-saundersi (nom. inval.)]
MAKDEGAQSGSARSGSARKTPLESPLPDCKPATKTDLTAEEEKKYSTLLSRAKEFAEVRCDKDKAKTGPVTADERRWLTRECLLRYLRATRWNVDEAGRRLLSTLAWRREYGIDDFTAEYISPEQETGKQMIAGFDRLARPCLYLNPGRQNTDASPRQLHHLFYNMERVIDLMPPGVETLSLLINFKASKQKQNTSVSVMTSREMLNILQNHYPERLGKALIINGLFYLFIFLSWVVGGFFKIITPFIDPVTREKLKFNEDMRLYVPAEQLWNSDWGGEMDFEYEHATYWSALHDMCRRRRDERVKRWEAAGSCVGESELYLAGGTDVSAEGFRLPGLGPSSPRSSSTATAMAGVWTSMWPPRESSQHQAANMSSPPFPPGLMDSFLVSTSPLVQLAIFIYRQLGSNLGLDPSVVLTFLGLVWALVRFGAHVYDLFRLVFDRYFTCAMYVSERDHIYMQLMKWLSNQQTISSNRFLMAQTVWKSAWEDEDEHDNSLTWTSDSFLNFSNHAAKSKPRYVPALGSTGFWHAGTYFYLRRKKESLFENNAFSPVKSVEEIKISCSGRSMVAEPIKRLLAEAKAFYYQDTYRKTTIYRPRPKGQRHEGSMWQQVARRPVRPMSTVVLDAAEKQAVMADINEYLHPATPRWYASRGIPLRRGYLFHGPPGTGKTSFSFALAGVFGIDIYVISLQDVNVSEEDLATLFTRLPRRCIVLLEDIDTAGLRRDTMADVVTNGVRKGKKQKTKERDKKKDGSETDSSSTGSESEDRKRRRRKRDAKKDSSSNSSSSSTAEGISLSGLLNAIDGVASHEGRVLIMTTNTPESLDPALVRPGRVDVQVSFTNASGEQAAELFRRMYELSSRRMNDKKDYGNDDDNDDGELDVSGEKELEAVAAEFGKKMPAGQISPAEIQGFLLKRKKSPRKALEDAKGWVEASVRQKASHSTVATVQ